MQQAIGYIRISTKDQSNFSLDGQEKYIRDFASKNNYELLNIFRDEGQSAKSFDRPDWKSLESFVKSNTSAVRFLIVSKYDRFSRNVSDALKMMEMLENKYDIRVMSVMEPIMLHPKSPYFFQFRTQMLLGAQVEWLVIRDRTKFGIHQAALNGRYVCTAPFGYLNKRDDRNKPVLEIDETKAIVVKRMYDMFLQGAPLREIHLEAKRHGYKNNGNSAVKRTLLNPLYAGLVHVPAYYDDPEQIVRGIHQAIISEATWWQVNKQLTEKPSQTKAIFNEDVPLRGVLKCFCGRNLTAGNSRGKKKHVWYYKCNTHVEYNLNAKKLHAMLEQVLEELSIPDAYIEYLQNKAKEVLSQALQEHQLLISEKKREVHALSVKMEKLEEKFLNDDMDAATFKKWKARYQQEMAVIDSYLHEKRKPVELVWNLFNEQLPKLANIKWLFEKSDVHNKQAIIRGVFNSKLYFEDGSYRTPYILPLFALKAASLAEKRLLIVEQPNEKSGNNLECTPDGSWIEPLQKLLLIIKDIKVA